MFTKTVWNTLVDFSWLKSLVFITCVRVTNQYTFFLGKRKIDLFAQKMGPKNVMNGLYLYSFLCNMSSANLFYPLQNVLLKVSLNWWNLNLHDLKKNLCPYFGIHIRVLNIQITPQKSCYGLDLRCREI